MLTIIFIFHGWSCANGASRSREDKMLYLSRIYKMCLFRFLRGFGLFFLFDLLTKRNRKKILYDKGLVWSRADVGRKALFKHFQHFFWHRSNAKLMNALHGPSSSITNLNMFNNSSFGSLIDRVWIAPDRRCWLKVKLNRSKPYDMSESCGWWNYKLKCEWQMEANERFLLNAFW